MDFLAQINAELEAAEKILSAGDVTDEAMEKYEEHVKNAEDLKAKQESLEAIKARAAKFEKPAPRRAAAPSPSASVQVGEPEFTKDPMKGFKKPQEFFKAVIKERGRTVASDERLRFLAVAGSDEQSAANDIYGGFLVPEGMVNAVGSIPVETNPMAGRTLDIPMDSPIVGLPSFVDEDHSTGVSAGITVTRKAETAAASSSRAQFRVTKLAANSLFGLSYTTEELLQDSPSSVAALLGAQFEKAFADKDFEELIRGTGSGEPEGVLNANAKISVAKETSQTSDTIVKENILKMRARAYGYNNMIWIANHDTYPQIAVVGGDGNGSGNLWQQSPAEGRPDMLLGRPIFFSEYAETLGDDGDLILVDPSAIYTGTYQPLQSAESIHVRFEEHERTFKFYKRNDARCAWKNALTPRKGANTLSPIITLAARA